MWITVPQHSQGLEFFLSRVQCSQHNLVFFYEWIQLCICCMLDDDGLLAVYMCVWIEEFCWIEWMPFLWPLNKMTYFSDRTLFFCRGRASPLPVLFPLFLSGYSFPISRQHSLCTVCSILQLRIKCVVSSPLSYSRVSGSTVCKVEKHTRFERVEELVATKT